jgi:hypothetical protein
MNTMAAAVAELKRVADAVSANARAARSTNDAQGWLARSRDAAREALGKIRTAAAKRYGTADQRPTTDSTGEVRDAVDRANKATDPRDQIRAINDANRAFHSARTRDHLEDVLPQSGTRAALERQIGRDAGSGAKTPAELNAMYREHYARR